MKSKKPEDKKVGRIDDTRLIGYTKRIRSGRTQVFHTGSDERDFDRWRADGGPSGHNVEMHDKPDTIKIDPPEKHWYAELIDGEWWWLNGCGECNGRERGWNTYIECDKHDVCRTCAKSRPDAKTAWGGSNGWQCEKCRERERVARRTEALEFVAAKEYDAWDYIHTTKIVCPHCASSYEHDCDVPEGDETCEVCGGEYTVSPYYELTFSTECKGARIIK